MKMSIIDQRPIQSTMRYSTVRSCSRPVQPRCVLISRIVEADQLQHRHGDRGEEHQRGERPHAGIQQLAHAAQDGAGLAGAELDHGQHRIDVGRHVQHRRGEQQRPGARRCCRACARAAGDSSAGSARRPRGRLTRPQVWQPIAPGPGVAARQRSGRAGPSPPTPPAGRACASAATIVSSSAASA